MSNASDRYSIAHLLVPTSLAKLAGIGVVAAAFVASFAWAGGWFTPGALTPARIIDTFQQANGPHPGFRRNHSKGVCFAGTFTGSGAASRLSTAQLFGQGTVPVFGRFALAAAVPMVPDAPKTVRSMAVQFNLANGEMWRTGMNDIPVFPTKDGQAFFDLLRAGMPDKNTGKPDPDLMKAFVAAHPESGKAFGLIGATSFSSGFADAQYNGLNAFLFTNSDGKVTPVRWSVVPVDPFQPALATAPDDKNFLFTALAERLKKGPAEWRLMVTIGQAGDPTNDATVPWPDSREKVDAGTVRITSLASETEGNCRDINFDPTVLPAGIGVSDDPLLSARAAAYATSFNRREGEPKTPSAVQITGGK
jgi:catalase